VACTLTPSEAPARVRRWQLLHERAAPLADLRPGRLEIRYPPADGVLAELHDLVDAERACCSFVTWDVTTVEGRPTVRVTAPADRPESVVAVAAMFGVDEGAGQAPAAP
jgi:hypothetical protein